MSKLNLILAPLAGVTDSSFRQICHEHGCNMSYTEMVSAKGLYYKNKNTEDLLKIDPAREGSVGIQLFGHEPEMFAIAVKALEDRPNFSIDINMGCPVPKVYKNGEGSALLNNPKLAAECVKACVSNTKKPVSIKMRLCEHSIDFALAMQDAGASQITVHGRTREQYYSGKANWNAIKAIKERIAIPLIGNGDVFSREDAVRMIEETGVDGVMIARGAMGNPWIFEGRTPDWTEIKETIIKHASLLVADKGEYAGIRQMRAHAGCYIKGIKGAASVRAKINQCETLDQLVNLIKEI